MKNITFFKKPSYRLIRPSFLEVTLKLSLFWQKDLFCVEHFVLCDAWMKLEYCISFILLLILSRCRVLEEMKEILFNVPNCIGYLRIALIVVASNQADNYTRLIFIVLAVVLDLLGKAYLDYLHLKIIYTEKRHWHLAHFTLVIGFKNLTHVCDTSEEGFDAIVSRIRK